MQISQTLKKFFNRERSLFLIASFNTCKFIAYTLSDRCSMNIKYFTGYTGFVKTILKITSQYLDQKIIDFTIVETGLISKLNNYLYMCYFVLNKLKLKSLHKSYLLICYEKKSIKSKREQLLIISERRVNKLALFYF